MFFYLTSSLLSRLEGKSCTFSFQTASLAPSRALKFKDDPCYKEYLESLGVCFRKWPDLGNDDCVPGLPVQVHLEKDGLYSQCEKCPEIFFKKIWCSEVICHHLEKIHTGILIRTEILIEIHIDLQVHPTVSQHPECLSSFLDSSDLYLIEEAGMGRIPLTNAFISSILIWMLSIVPIADPYAYPPPRARSSEILWAVACAQMFFNTSRHSFFVLFSISWRFWIFCFICLDAPQDSRDPYAGVCLNCTSMVHGFWQIWCLPRLRSWKGG